MSKDIEFESHECIKQFQEELLRKDLLYLRENSPYYNRLFESYKIDTDRILKIEDLTRFPLPKRRTCNSITMIFVVSPKKIIDYITTSGTLGDPVLFGCTEKDLQRLA